MEGKKFRIAAVGDIHVNEDDKGKYADYFKEVSSAADVLLITGDLTDTGHTTEAEILAKDLRSCRIPVVAVLGNHDYEADKQDEIKKILHNDRVHILDGDSVVIDGIGFAGIKGFGGGFGRYSLPMWGEKMNKNYVSESVNEALRLDQALTRLNTEFKFVLLHYSPIPDTIVGEPEQIFPFMGSSRLAEPIDTRQVDAVFHGHAHIGTLEGKTAKGIKVFNVALKVLKKSGLEKPWFIYEVETESFAKHDSVEF